jgi:hypothetical protein
MVIRLVPPLIIDVGEKAMPDTVGGVDAACPITRGEWPKRTAAQLSIARSGMAELNSARLRSIDFSCMLSAQGAVHRYPKLGLAINTIEEGVVPVFTAVAPIGVSAPVA